MCYEFPSSTQFACFAGATPINQQNLYEHRCWGGSIMNEAEIKFPRWTIFPSLRCTQWSEEIYLWNRFNWLSAVRWLRIMLCMQPFNCCASVCGWLPQPQRMQFTLIVGVFFPSSYCRKHSSISSHIVQSMFLMTLITWKTPLKIRKRYTLANKKSNHRQTVLIVVKTMHSRGV